MDRGYQHGFSKLYPEVGRDSEGRRRKAMTMVAVLADYFGGAGALSGKRLLDVGAGNGVFDHALAEHFAEVRGIDIDPDAIARAQALPPRENLRFSTGDAMRIEVAANDVDVVACAHVYEHVPDARRLLSEIHRVLKPGGVCYFAAANRFQPIEPHYGLPLLSVVPKSVAHLYLRAFGRGQHYYEQLVGYPSLRQLVKKFRVHDYTRRLIDEPQRFHTDYMLPPGSRKQRLARLIVRVAYGLIPTYIWLLEKSD
jgi:2-polyprenyl-3-methyl-5-hydroxy-6-metoxy-1,4-benzoquinol methylase